MTLLYCQGSWLLLSSLALSLPTAHFVHFIYIHNSILPATQTCLTTSFLKGFALYLLSSGMLFLHTFVLLSLLPSEKPLCRACPRLLFPFFYFNCCCGNQLRAAVSWLHRESITFTPGLVFHFIMRCQQKPLQCRTVHLTDLPLPVCDGSWCLSLA